MLRTKCVALVRDEFIPAVVSSQNRSLQITQGIIHSSVFGNIANIDIDCSSLGIIDMQIVVSYWQCFRFI